MKPLSDELIQLLYKTGDRRQSVGNVADPTTTTTWTWEIDVDDATVFIKIQVVWDVDLLISLGSDKWFVLNSGHDTDFGELVQDTWGRLEDLYGKEHTYDDDDVIKGWR